MQDQIHDTYDYGAGVVYPPVKPKTQSNGSRIFNWIKRAAKPITICFAIFGLIVLCASAPIIPALALSFSTILYAIALLIASFYGRGWVRPYSIFGLAVFVVGAFFLVETHRPEELLIGLIVLHLIGCVTGFTAALMHGFLKRRSGRLPVPKVPILGKWLSND